MCRHFVKVVCLLFLFSGCAQKTLKITDDQGKVLGVFNAGFDWHFYGQHDSIDYLLHQCAKDLISKGYTISDERLLTIDYTLPDLPAGKSWNKNLYHCA
jgi:hypothetical protein